MAGPSAGGSLSLSAPLAIGKGTATAGTSAGVAVDDLELAESEPQVGDAAAVGLETVHEPEPEARAADAEGAEAGPVRARLLRVDKGAPC